MGFYQGSVLYECARCHERFSVDAEPEKCPNCHAEAGLEKHKAQLPFPMMAFGGLLATALLMALVGFWVGIGDSPEQHDVPHWKNNGVP